MNQDVILSEYRHVWLFAIFDLPVVSEDDKRNYTHFRKALLNDGFLMIQYSVYARYCNGEEAAEAHRRRIKASLPPDGEVRILHVTDRQFTKMDVYIGKKRNNPESPPEQLVLF